MRRGIVSFPFREHHTGQKRSQYRGESDFLHNSSASIDAGFAHHWIREVLTYMANTDRARWQRKVPPDEFCSVETFADEWNSLDCSECRGP